MVGGQVNPIIMKVRKNNQYFELFLVFFTYAKVCKVYYICLIWLRDFVKLTCRP